MEGGGEGLSDLPPAVHSTTGCATVKTDTDSSVSTEDKPQQPLNTSEVLVEHKYRQELTHAEFPDEQGRSGIDMSGDHQSGRSDSSTSSPRHIAKKARVIASGGDLLEDVKKSYAFVCGANMFAPPTRPAVSHPRLQAPVGYHALPVSYSENASSYVRRASRDGYDNSFQDTMQNLNDGSLPITNRSYNSSSLQSANFADLTPEKGFRRQYSNEWGTSPASGLHVSAQTNAMHYANRMGHGTADFRPDDAQSMQGHSSSVGTDCTGAEFRGAVPYVDGVQFPRTAENQSHADEYHVNYQRVNQSPRSTVHQSGRSYGYQVGPYAGSYQHVGRQSGAQQNEYYQSPLASPYRRLPSHASDTTPQRGTVPANESGRVYPSGQLYRNLANVNTSNYVEKVDRSLTASPVHHGGRSTTPGFVSSYSVQPGIQNYMPDNKSSSLQYTGRDSATPTGQKSLMNSGMQPVAPGIQSSGNNRGGMTQDGCSFNPTNAGIDLYAEQQSFPQSPASDRSAVNQLTPRRGVVIPDVEQPYGPSGTVPAGRPEDSGCLSFVRHLIGSGSGPYRSHPLFPLLRDLVIADMNFEAPSFPYPLIAGLPRNFDRLISNYFSCTRHNTNTASVEPSVDAVVMDALRYAHSALLGNYDLIL